ncbi:hypothetical protein CFOL_v3_15597 [Cephalotus follicularis]|uniref:Uncharacterized protein n=1 Tax=Cephalotus follicularis TaxID=3775 RepID=A0A1Q3BW96_CEPFO|nr:hypothetical protein CFOL_v3_15597 [Cephalotus follicularis]
MFTFVIFILLALGILSIPNNSGNSPKPNNLSSIVRNTVERGDGDEGRGEQWVEVISWEPKEECEYLIGLAKPHMQKSTVVDSETGKSRDSSCIILSTILFLSFSIIFLDFFTVKFHFILPLFFAYALKFLYTSLLQSAYELSIIRDIENKIASFTFIPVGNQ